MPNANFWQWLVSAGYITGDPAYYSGGKAQAGEFSHAFRTAWAAIQASGNDADKTRFWKDLVDQGYIEGDPNYYAKGQAQPEEFENAFNVAEEAALTGAAEGAAPAFTTPPPGLGDELTSIGGVVLPTGSRLVSIRNPKGSDVDELFFVVGDVFGIQEAYEVGDRAAVERMFGGVGAFDSFQVINQGTFDQDYVLAGPIDEIANSTESLQSQRERDMRALGVEGLPAWVLEDQQALNTWALSVREGWSSAKLYNQLSSTTAFRERFTGLDAFMQREGLSNFQTGVSRYLQEEQGFRSALLGSRGPNTNVGNDYIGGLIGGGWSVDQAQELLDAERDLRDNPEALANINEILQFQGRDPLSADDFLDVIVDGRRAATDPDYRPGDLFEAINEGLAVNALFQQGLDISPQLAMDLTDEAGGIVEPGAFSEMAQAAALNIMRNSREIDLQRMGLGEDDVIQAAFGRGASAEVQDILERFGRERTVAARGYTGASSFFDQFGRLRVQGIGT